MSTGTTRQAVLGTEPSMLGDGGGLIRLCTRATGSSRGLSSSTLPCGAALSLPPPPPFYLIPRRIGSTARGALGEGKLVTAHLLEPRQSGSCTRGALPEGSAEPDRGRILKPSGGP